MKQQQYTFCRYSSYLLGPLLECWEGGGGGGNCQHTISLNKSNGSELLNMDVLSLSDQQPAVRVCLYTIILSKYIRYRTLVILGKL